MFAHCRTSTLQNSEGQTVGAGVTKQALVTAFSSGSLIIPMDVDANGQDGSMLRAYGLVYELLRHGVPVHWIINSTKLPGGEDFSINTSAVRTFPEGAVLAARSYRGGPFIIDAADAAQAAPIITRFQSNGTVMVHELMPANSLNADVARVLVAAPRIAVFVDGNEAIALNDLNAAGIADAGGRSWTSSSPDVLTEADIIGTTAIVPNDGILLDGAAPRHCTLLSMHYNDTADTSDVVREIRSWLESSQATHAIATCDSTRTFENAVGGKFLTVNGLDDDGIPTATPTIRQPNSPLTQIDGTFAVDSGSVDSMAAILATYKSGVTSLINESTSPLTQRNVMISGRMDGGANTGRVTYLAGHDYSLDLPMSTHPQTNGVRLLLNALLSSDCALPARDAPLAIAITGPTLINTSQQGLTIAISNPGNVQAENARLVLPLPSGATYVVGSASPAPLSVTSGSLTWNLPPVSPSGSTTITLSLHVPTDGTYATNATVAFAKRTVYTVESNTLSFERETVPPEVNLFGASSYYATLTPTFAFSTGDAVSRVCRIDANAFSPCTSPYTSAVLLEGSHTFQIRGQDQAGNVTTATHGFVVDLTAPNTSFAAPPVNPSALTANAAPRIYFTVDDDSPSSTTCSVDGATPSLCVSPFQTPALADGIHTVAVTATDLAGNVDLTPGTLTFTVDATAPVSSFVSTPGAETQSASATFTFTTNEDATLECDLDGLVFPCTSPVTTPPLATGSHTLGIRARDSLGNTEATANTFSWTVLAPSASGGTGATGDTGPSGPSGEVMPTPAPSGGSNEPNGDSAAAPVNTQGRGGCACDSGTTPDPTLWLVVGALLVRPRNLRRRRIEAASGGLSAS